MTRMALVAAAAVSLLLGAASGAVITGINRYWMGKGGGVTLEITGEGFSEDQFSEFDPSLGNRVYLVNAEDEIDCPVFEYLTSTTSITCVAGARTRDSAPAQYQVIVYSDGVRASGDYYVGYAWWRDPKIQHVTPHWSLPGEDVTFSGWFQTSRYYQVDLEDPLENNPDNGAVLTKVFLGGVECDMLDENEQFIGPFSDKQLTCRPGAKLIGAMNSSVYVNERGASVNDRVGMYIDSKDKLFQYHSYPAISSVSPSTGSNYGGTLITIDGVGFDPYMDQTKVEVGGAECDIQEISDTQIKCFTPYDEAVVSSVPDLPKEGGQGMLVELYPMTEAVTDSQFWQEETWTPLDSSHAGYTSFTSNVPELEFPVAISSNTLGRVRGFLHPPHDGSYVFLGSAGDKASVRISPDGDPANAVTQQPIELKQGTPAYVEVRFRADADTTVLIRMKDYNAKYVSSQTFKAGNEKQELKFNIAQVMEKQSITITGASGAMTLFLNGMSSQPVDIADSALVREQLLDMTEQKCERDFSAVRVMHHTDFEDDNRTPGALGGFVDRLQPYCGRKMFRLKRTDPRVYRETDEELMVDANTYKYLCFAISGRMETSMAINFKWKDDRGRNRDDTFGFNREFSPNGWTYHCEDLQEVMMNSWAGPQYPAGAKLLVKNVVVPKPLGPTDEVYIDEVVFSSDTVAVPQTRPSALKQQGILVEDVEVQDVTETSYALKFLTTNCMSGIPLLGIFEGAADNSFVDILSASQSYTFEVGGGTVAVARVDGATSPLGGTWDVNIWGREIKNIPADIHEAVLQSYLEAAMGTDLQVDYGGSCKNYHYHVQWLVDPGQKELAVVDGTNLIFDGDDVALSVRRVWEGRHWHHPLPADFMTAYSVGPQVTVRVNGYSAACLGDCSFSYVTLDISHTGGGTPIPNWVDPVVIRIEAEGLTSDDISDYNVWLGDKECTVVSVDRSVDPNELSASCEVLVAGTFPIRASVQPYGMFAFWGTATFSPASDISLSISEGPRTGYYPVTLTSASFPMDLAGWAGEQSYIRFDGNECELSAAQAREVTCMVPPNEVAKSASIMVSIDGAVTFGPSFTYTDVAAEAVPTITSLSSSTLSVYGEEELVISGSGFGASEGSVTIGSEPCEVSNWVADSVTCTTPSLAPGTYSINLLTDGLGLATTDVSYVFSVTSTSQLKGSVKGGTTVTLAGEGFGSDCSRLRVLLGERDVCEVTECTPTSLTCVTKLVPTTHKITNTGYSSEESVVWSPRLLDVREGDIVTWEWTRLSPNTQLQYSICQVADPMADCDLTGFSSGAPTQSGQFTLAFNHQGIYDYAGQPASTAGLVMRGRINVVRPQTEARKMTVLLGDQEATINLSGAEEPVTGDGCSATQAPLADCTEPDPTIPEDGGLYFLAHACHTPIATAISTDAFTGVPGLSGIQLIDGVALSIEGSGFNDESDSRCKTEVRVGDAACAVSQSAATLVTCDPSLEDLGVSFYPVMVQVFGNGIAALEVSNYDTEGRVVVVPYVADFSPIEGSLGGGTPITITGSGLQGVSADPVVRLGGKVCELQAVTPTSVTCLTPASATATTASLTVTVMGIEAILFDSLPSYTYSEALTPRLTDVVVTGDTVTLTGQNLGTDSSKLTVTLKRVTVSRQERDVEVEDEEEDLMVEMDEDNILDMMADEEVEEMISGYMDEGEVSMADAVHRDKEQQLLLRRHKLALADVVEAPEGFWGTFTGTGAKTFKETVMMGAWRMAGTAATAKTGEDSDGVQIVPKRMTRSVDDLPSEYTCEVNTLSDTEATCTISGLPAGTYTAEVDIDGAGFALQDGLSAVAEPVITSFSPSSGSVNGGALLTIVGSGFIDGDTTVSLCSVESVTSGEIKCRVAPGTAGAAVDVVVSVLGSSDVTAASTFTYDSAVTPVVTTITPDTISASGTVLTLAGSGFKSGATDPDVFVGEAACTVTSATDIQIICTAPELPGGSYDVVVKEATYGDSSAVSLTYESAVGSTTTLEGGFGGSLVTITGYGFDPATTVTVCDNPCEIVGSPTVSEISCVVPPEEYTGVDVSCDLKVIDPSGTVTTTLTYQYLAAKTSTVTDVSPKRGGTAGGTVLTITGTGFASTGNVVTIDGSSCDVTAESETSITCRTSAHEGPGEFPVMVDVPNNGFAVTDENGVFHYIDRWSSVYTWGDNPIPTEGQLVAIDEGQTILLDQSTPVLKGILLQGGNLVFDMEATEELVLRAEFILIVGGGSLSIGSEEVPFTGDAVIELHGNTQSIELPIYGAKVLAVREGTLDLHGAHVPITWTYLDATAAVGATSITLADEVTWKAGDQIVVASTGLRFPVNENEVRTIQSIDADGRTINFADPLEYEHVSITQTLAGREVATRAEVGLLTRNVKIRGNINEDFVENIEGCEDTFDPNQFATQTCFNGRFGDDVASDQFGATVMLSGKNPDQELVTGRIEYVEVTEAGQAFQLGRYPLHFHLVGDVSASYIRGCAVHRTYNRAITIHAANRLHVERNVAYNNMGHAIFTEDGVEVENVIQYNLAIFTRTSSSLLNVDITPASFWVVNPNNIVRHNAAAGGTHFGYWYRTERHPSGPSATNDYCPNNEVMGQFFNNTAHSMGRYGLWVFSMDGYHPRAGVCRGSDLVAKWEDFTVWHCERGAEIVFGTNLQFHNFVALNNEKAGLEMVKMQGGNRVDMSPGIFNSVVVCHSALGTQYCTSETRGIIAPKMYTFSISGVTFVNFDVEGSAALAGCSQCKPRQGGFRTQVERLTFESSPNRLHYLWQHETIWFDEDGSLSGTVGASVVPWMDILPTDSCATDDALSVNPAVPGAVCSSDMKFLRFNIKGPNIDPPSLQGRLMTVTNAHGSVDVPYFVKRLTTEGWMGILYTGDTYEWFIEGSEQLTDIKYNAETRLMSPGDYYYVKHTLIQEPDEFGTTGTALESKPALPDPSTDVHGDYYWDSANMEMTYMVSYNQGSRKNLREFTTDAGVEREIAFEVFKYPPTVPPVPTGRPDTALMWSDTETWKEVPVGSGGHPTEAEYGLPVEGDEIIIPAGMWLIVDTATPKLGRVYVYGTLEFDDSMDHYFEATIIYIQGGMVAAGLSKSEPFTHQLEIQLRGSIDPSDPDNEEFPTPAGSPSLGWKAIGVYGALKLHGTVSGQSWHKLGQTAEAGSTTLTLAEAPDASWVNKMVVVSSTSKEATEGEVRTVTAISGNQLTLDTALEYQHLGVTYDLDGTPVTLAAEVGLLSRNIVVRGSPTEDSFGGRILVSKIDPDYVGSIQLDGVQLDNMGQDSFTSLQDPRYSLALYDLGAVEDGDSYITRSSFSINYNVALGLFGTSNVAVEDNVIYYALDSGVRDESGSNFYRRNLIATVLFLGTYGDRFDTQNLNWYGAFQLDNAPNIVLEGNVVAGAEQAGFKTYGEMCEDDPQWANNEVHGTIFGVMSWKKSGSGEECRRIRDFYAWRISSTAFYHQYYASSVIENVMSVDNPLGVNQLVLKPPALSHEFSEKTATTKGSVFVGASPAHTCTFQRSTSEIMTFYSDKIKVQGVNGGNTGIWFGSFVSGPNLAPKKSFSPAGAYPALHGRTDITNNKFINFETRSCGKNVALMANPASDDAIHPVFVSGLSFSATPRDNYVFIPRANVEKVDPSDCVDMDCDGHKKVVLKDTDGTLLDVADSTLVSEAEYEWDGDPRRGVGDYRIPVSLRQKDDGSEITAAEKFPNKGIVRDDTCSLVAPWQAWMCRSLQHFMMIIESMDTDTEVRRLSPIALIANPGTNGYVDLLNGPMDRGWCFGYTCQERISTFYAVLASDQVYEMAMTSTPPQVLRLHPLTYSDEVVVLRMFFPKLQRYDVYVDGTFVPPKNLDTSASKYQLLPEDPSFEPTLSDAVGSNYLQRSAKMLHVVVGKSQIITIKTTPMITLSSGLVVSNDEFYEQNLLQNLADLFGLSAENIVMTNIVAESRQLNGSRAMVTYDVKAEIASGPAASLDGSGSAMSNTPALSYDTLVGALQNAVNKFQEGTCEACATLETISPQTPPPAEAPPKATEEEGSVVVEGGELFSDKQQKEEEEKLTESLEPVDYDQPTAAELLTGVPAFVVVDTSFSQQPSVIVKDSEGLVVQDLGFETDPWQITATLTGGPEGAVLQGTTTVPYMNGAATFTDLAVSEPGEGYSLSFSITHPADAPDLSTALDGTFRARAELPVAVKIALPEEALVAGQPISLSVQLVDEDSEEVLDGAQFQDQVIVGELLEKRGRRGALTVVKRFYEIYSSAAEFPIEFTVDEVLVRYRLFTRVSIVPGEWYLEAQSPRLVVYADSVSNPSAVVTRNVELELRRWKLVPKLDEDLEDAVLTWLMKNMNMEKKGVQWGSVTMNQSARKAVRASLQVSGTDGDIKATVDDLCKRFKKRSPVTASDDCTAATYFLKKVFLDGKYVTCKRMLSLPEEATVVESLPSLNATQTVKKIGMHKFNRG